MKMRCFSTELAEIDHRAILSATGRVDREGHSPVSSRSQAGNTDQEPKCRLPLTQRNRNYGLDTVPVTTWNCLGS